MRTFLPRISKITFQSLLRQVKPSNDFLGQSPQRGKQRFNPFFVRSSLPTGTAHLNLFVYDEFQSLLRQVKPSNRALEHVEVSLRLGFNPFFVRSSLPTLEYERLSFAGFQVSIPSSSGQAFQPRPREARENAASRAARIIVPSFPAPHALIPRR